MTTRSLTFLVLALIVATRGHAEGAVGVKEQSRPDGAYSQTEDTSLLDAALVASGVTDSTKRSAYRARLETIVSRLERAPGDKRSVQSQGQTLLRGLFEHLLTGRYQAACTEVDRTLDTGDYNCVTATILYRYLAVRAGLPVTTLAERHHVYCRLDSDPPVTIQTTSAAGFLIDIGAASRPGSEQARELTDEQLVAKICYNRGVALAERRQFRAAVDLLQIACRLDVADTVARQNLLAGLNNWGLAEADAGHWQVAAEILTDGLRLAPDCAALRDNEVHVYQRWTVQLCRDGDFDQALRILEAGYQRRPDVPLFANGRQTVREIWRQSLLAQGRPKPATTAPAR